MFLAIILVLFCLICSGFFSGAETAFFSLPSTKIRLYQAQKERRKQLVSKLLAHPQDLIVTLMMLNIGVNLLIQNLISNIVGDDSNWLLKVGLPLLLTLLFGELLPKSFALQHNETLAPLFSPIIYIPYKLSKPIRSALTKLVNNISEKMFFFLKKEKEIGREELLHVLQTSQEQGILVQEECQLIAGYLDLHEISIKELMRPKDEIVFYDCQDPIDTLEQLFFEKKYSKVPVCDDGFENLLGVIDAREFFFHRHKIFSPKDLELFLQKPFFVPRTASAHSLLEQFNQKHKRLAITVDEYGEICGIISPEDLIEVVTGEFIDSRDAEENYVRSSDNIIIANGRLELSEFEDIFGVALHSKSSMVTIAGWLTEQLKMIPRSGTNYTYAPFLFHVLEAEPNRIVRVYIRKMSSEEARHFS